MRLFRLLYRKVAGDRPVRDEWNEERGRPESGNARKRDR